MKHRLLVFLSSLLLGAACNSVTVVPIDDDAGNGVDGADASDASDASDSG